MKYTYKLLSLSNGHTILTPTGEKITRTEFIYYFDILCEWLKEINPKAYVKINPNPDNRRTYGGMMYEIYKKILYSSTSKPIRFQDTRKLAFLFVLSYYIQEEPASRLSQYIAYVLGKALLNWLPIPELFEDYLSIAAQGKDNNLAVDAAYQLVKVFCPNFGSGNYYVDRDAEKALKYATLVYENPMNGHGFELYDYSYLRALFENDPANAELCLDIIDDKLKQMEDTEEGYFGSPNVFRYIDLKLDIALKVKFESRDLGIEELEKYLLDQPNREFGYDQCIYQLAKCYITGLNNPIDYAKAEVLLMSMDDWIVRNYIAALLARIYVEQRDYDQAYSISMLAKYSREDAIFFTEGEKELEDMLKEVLPHINSKSS